MPGSIERRRAAQSRLIRRVPTAAIAGLLLRGGIPAASHAQGSPVIALVVGVKGDPFYVTMQKGA